MKQRIIVGLLCIAAALLVFALAELLYIAHTGTPVAAPTIPREPQTFGSKGQPLKFLVMGDSTSIGQGAEYAQSYAYAGAEHLAKDHTVIMLNVGISGAVAKDLIATQLPKTLAFKPDIVLLAVGANDATHFTSGASFERSVQTVIDSLREQNPSLKIVVTGCPAMGSVARFPIGARQLAGLRERQINHVYERLISKNNLILAPVARETGPAFAADPSLFAADKFHPNARGYALWIPVVNKGLDNAL